MGVLTAAGDRGGSSEGGGEGGGSILGEAPEANDPAPPVAQEPEKPTFVPFSAVEKIPGSRRQKAEAEIEAKIKRATDEAEAKLKRDYDSRIAQQEQTLAQMRGMMEGFQKFAPQQQAPAPVVQEDASQFHRQAQEALDAGKFTEYQRLKDRAYEVTMESRIAKERETMREEMRKAIPQQVPPMIQALISKHDNVAMQGERGMEAVAMKDKELAFYGVAQGPERLRKAFELADQMLGGQQKPQAPQYDRNNASSLAGIPTQRPASGGGSGDEPGVNLSPLQVQAAKNAGMTKEQYVKWMNPEKYVKPRW